MPSLSEARKALAAAVGAVDHVPEVIDPPCRVVEPGDPYLTYQGAESFAWDAYVATMFVYVLVPASDNAAMASDLDAALLASIEAIEDADWSVTRVGKPGTFITADWQAYGVQLTASARVSRA